MGSTIRLSAKDKIAIELNTGYPSSSKDLSILKDAEIRINLVMDKFKAPKYNESLRLLNSVDTVLAA